LRRIPARRSCLNSSGSTISIRAAALALKMLNDWNSYVEEFIQVILSNTRECFRAAGAEAAAEDSRPAEGY
jgi:hypothetical protein